MEFEDWGPVIARIEHDHRQNEVAVAKAFSFALMGDEVDWRQHLTNARRFIVHMRRTVPACKFRDDTDAVAPPSVPV